MSQTAKQTPPADGADRHSSLPPAEQTATPPPGAPAPARAVPPRRGLLRWILIPLAAVGVGFIGYRLGQTGTSSSTASAGFGQGTQGRSQGNSGQGSNSSSQGSGAQSGAAGSRSGQATGNRGAAGQTGTGTETGRAAGAGGTGAGTTGTGAAAGTATGTGTEQARQGSGSGRGQAGSSGVVTPVQATEVKAGSLSTERHLTGTVAASQTVSVTPQTSGTVSAVLRNVGDSVSTGQSVLTLTNADLNSSVQSAQNTLDSAQATLDSQRAQIGAGTASLQQAITSAQSALTNAETTYAAQQKLYAIGAIARSALQEQEVQVQSARNSLVAAQTNLSNTTRTNASGLTTAQLNVQKAQIALSQARSAAGAAKVAAPFDGQITAMNVTAGQYVGTSTAAFTVVSTSQQVKVNVPTTEAATLPVGAALTLVVGQQKYPLKVTQNAGSATSGSVPITAKFLAGSSGTVQQPAAGTVGSVVYTAKVASGVLVPSTALQTDGSTTYVFTISGGKARQNTVTVLGQAGTQSALSGIEAGAQVISQPPTGLLDGSSVTTSSAGSGRSGRSQGAGGPPGGMP